MTTLLNDLNYSTIDTDTLVGTVQSSDLTVSDAFSYLLRQYLRVQNIAIVVAATILLNTAEAKEIMLDRDVRVALMLYDAESLSTHGSVYYDGRLDYQDHDGAVRLKKKQSSEKLQLFLQNVMLQEEGVLR